jgi:hypothetical protein
MTWGPSRVRDVRATLSPLCESLSHRFILLQEFLYYEPRENDKHLSATLNNILQRPRRNTPKLVKQTYSVVSFGQLGDGKKPSLILPVSVRQFT